MNITTEEIKKLKSTKSEKEWNDMCDEIKRARNGEYPPDWWQQIMLSGLMTQISSSWDTF